MARCTHNVPPARQPSASADWVFAADAGSAEGGLATHFRFWQLWESVAPRGHLLNRLSSGCINWRPNGIVRGHSSGSPQTMAAPPSATTEMVPSEPVPSFKLPPAGQSNPCTPPLVLSFGFTHNNASLLVGSDGILAAGTDCTGQRCLFELLPVAVGDAGGTEGWFHLKSLATGHLVRLVHSSMPTQASWGGAIPPFATLKTRAELRRSRLTAASSCPVSGHTTGAPPSWRYNVSLWDPLVRRSLSPWVEGTISPTVLDAAFSRQMYPGPMANGLPGIHVSIRAGKVFYKTNSDYRMPLMLDMLRTVSRHVSLPDVEFVAHLWDHPKVRREQPMPVLAHYVDVVHRDIAMPAPWSWDERAHTWPQPFTKIRHGCARPWAARKPVLYFRGGCNGPTRGWRGPVWRFYPRKMANILSKRLPGRVDAGTYDHCDSPKLNKHEWGWDEQMEHEMSTEGPKRKVDKFDMNCEYRYLLHIDGNLASSRLASEMHVGSTIFKQDSFSSEYFYPLLRPWEHYIPLQNGLSDVEEKLRWADSHPREAERIASSAKAFAKEHLHVPSIACYWWHLLTAFAELQTYLPRTNSELGFQPL